MYFWPNCQCCQLYVKAKIHLDFKKGHFLHKKCEAFFSFLSKDQISFSIMKWTHSWQPWLKIVLFFCKAVSDGNNTCNLKKKYDSLILTLVSLILFCAFSALGRLCSLSITYTLLKAGLFSNCIETCLDYLWGNKWLSFFRAAAASWKLGVPKITGGTKTPQKRQFFEFHCSFVWIQ